MVADGVDPWDSNTAQDSFFFIVLVVVNLPPRLRYKRENLILWGIVDHKPKDSQQIYRLVVQDFKDGWKGFPVWDSLRDVKFRCRVMLLFCVFDYPGLVDALNHCGHMASKGCVKCTIRGVRPKSLKGMKFHRNMPGQASPVVHTHEAFKALAEHAQVDRFSTLRHHNILHVVVILTSCC
jgi:hypothetical protein